MSDTLRCPCREHLVLTARPGRVFTWHGEHNPRPGEVPLGKPCRCDDCNESDEPPREAYGHLYTVPDDLALWECSVCGAFSRNSKHFITILEWLDRDHPPRWMVEKSRAEANGI